MLQSEPWSQYWHNMRDTLQHSHEVMATHTTCNASNTMGDEDVSSAPSGWVFLHDIRPTAYAQQ